MITKEQIRNLFEPCTCTVYGNPRKQLSLTAARVWFDDPALCKEELKIRLKIAGFFGIRWNSTHNAYRFEIGYGDWEAMARKFMGE